MDGGIDRRIDVIDDRDEPVLPDYLVKTYTWAYLRPGNVRLLDNPVVVSGILWGNYRRLVEAARQEFTAGQRVLQAASVYGNLSSTLAKTLGDMGHLDVIDIAPLQVSHCRAKLRDRANTQVRVADAADPGPELYNAICCFFLLHEVPDTLKRSIVNALLSALHPGGKGVFVDYHKPTRLHPVRPIMSAVFRWLEPFANGLINAEIRDFADDADAYDWSKETYFGGLYQKVVAIRRPLSPRSAEAAPQRP